MENQPEKAEWPSEESINISPKELKFNWFRQYFYFLRKGVWFVLNLLWTICHVGGPANGTCHKSA